MRRQLKVLVLSAGLALGCVLGSPSTAGGRSVLDPLPDRSIPMTVVPPEYRRWWDNIRRCAEDTSTKPFDSVRFYIVLADSDGFRYAGEDSIAGLTLDGDRIILASPYVLDSSVVGHEELHVIRPPTSPRQIHDPLYFKRKCKNLVICVTYCQEER